MVASAGSVTLDGSASSDADESQTLTYAWTQTAGPTVTLSSTTAAKPTFTAPTLAAGDANAVPTAADDHASETIASFMANRANHLVVNQPELAHFLMGGCEGHLDAKITQANGSVDFASDQCKQVWATLKGAHSTGSDASADYVLGVIGSHVAVNPNLLVGGMVQLDYASETKGAAKTSGHGWLVGPYVVSRMQSQPLVFEGRALFGQTDNRVSPLGTYEDRFTTNRSLIQAALTGEIIKGDTTYKPRFGLTSTSDHQQAYVDSNGTTIAAQDPTLTEVEAGLSVEQAITTAQGKLLLKGGLTGIWAQTSGTAASLLDADYEGGRAKLDLGAEFALGETTHIGFSGYYDGLGAQNYKDWGVALNWETRF